MTSEQSIRSSWLEPRIVKTAKASVNRPCAFGWLSDNKYIIKLNKTELGRVRLLTNEGLELASTSGITSEVVV